MQENKALTRAEIDADNAARAMEEALEAAAQAIAMEIPRYRLSNGTNPPVVGTATELADWLRDTFGVEIGRHTLATGHEVADVIDELELALVERRYTGAGLAAERLGWRVEGA